MRLYLSNLKNIKFKLSKFGIILIGLDLVLFLAIGGYIITTRAQSNCLSQVASLAHAKILAPCIREEVNPTSGFTSKISLGNLVLKMEQYGIIDKSKIEALYKQQGGLSKDEQAMLDNQINTPLIINASNATWIVNLLWALGMSNKMAINEHSPVSGADVNNFASIGGWTLGKSDNGGDYFNRYSLIPLTSSQQTRVLSLAKSIYRPCCNNSSFFQDCNHGSAAMALIELGVSEGLSDTEIYKTILGFNSFWFSNNYLETALYFNRVKHQDWTSVNPKVILSKDYSSISGWSQNVDIKLQQDKVFIPSQNAVGCGV